MMSKIVTSLQRGQNSLLESPTGSGKSLAWLLALLAPGSWLLAPGSWLLALLMYSVTGKSLALLCAALAWQQAEQRKCDEFNELLDQATQAQSKELRDVLVNTRLPP